MARQETNYATSERMLRQVGGQGGFTLMEVIFIIVLASVFLAAIGLPLLSSISESDLPDIATVAYFLAAEKQEELSAVTAGSITDEARAAVSGYGDYDREVVVVDVNCDDLSTVESGSGCRKVTVTVYHDGKLPNGISVVTLRTSY